MKKRSIQILFIVSLAFNLAFIGFGAFRFIQIRRFSNPHRMFENVPQELKEHFREHREEVDPIRKEIDNIRLEFMTEMRNPEFSEDQIKEKLDRYLTRQAELERIMGDNLIELRKKLTPDQVEKFFSQFPPGKYNDHPKRQFPQNLKRRNK